MKGVIVLEFSVNSPVLFVIAGIVILIVLAQSVFFLVRALKRAKEIGMEAGKIKKIIRTAAIFTIAPAIAILIGVIALAKDLGIPLPWLRLSVIGSLSYETVAAANTINGMGLEMGKITALTASQYVTILAVMTVSILVGIWLAPIISKKMQKGLGNIDKRDKKWGEILTNAMFLGMISSFLGFVFCDFSSVSTGSLTGLIPVCVMLVSAIIMLICCLFAKKGARWLNDYALPISLICGMASAIPFTAWLV